MNRLDAFTEAYKKHIAQVVAEKPDLYLWPISELPQVSDRMIEAIKRGTFNKDSIAIKRTCKDFGIKHTYKAITEFIKGD